MWRRHGRVLRLNIQMYQYENMQCLRKSEKDANDLKTKTKTNEEADDTNEGDICTVILDTREQTLL